MIPRGLRNNNPGNIRQSSTTYKGEISPSKDKEFKQFETVSYGYRAMFVALHYYHSNLGLKSIRKMISRWAPPSENDTESYIRTVSRLSNHDPDKTIDLQNRNLMLGIVAAMSKVENGQDAVISDVIEGWKLYKADRK